MASELEGYTRALKKVGRPFDGNYKSHNLSKYQHVPLDEALGHQVDEEEIYEFNTDTKNTGYTLPTDKYIGPGNSVNLGTPNSSADKTAQQHDLEYFDANWQFHYGHADKAAFEKLISDSDRKAIRAFNTSGTFANTVGKDGLTIKHWVEKLTGQIYPSTGMPINYNNVPNHLHDYARAHSEHPGLRQHYPNWFSGNDSEINVGASSSGGSPAKKARVSAADSSQDSSSSQNTARATQGTTVNNSQAVSSSTGDAEVDAAMVLPGTAMGQGGQGDGNSNSSMPIYRAPAPLSVFGRKTSTFTKVHRFVTYGLAHTWINVDLTTPLESQRWLTTALSEIPWQYPFLYMNPSEFSLLQNGAYVSEVSISITHRGVRMAFETAAVSTQLATLNQIQNLQIAFGLNKCGWGTDRSYTISAGTPMVPTGVLAPVYGQYQTEMYGAATQATIETAIPNHQLGQKMPLRNYWTFVTTEQQFGGVPDLQQHIQFMDAKTTINQHIGTFTYKPKMGQLKTPLKHLRTGLPSNINENLVIPNNGQRTEASDISISQISTDGTGGLNTTGDNLQNPTNNFPSGWFDYDDPIEKSQHMKQGPWGLYKGAQVQPSVHIGIQAIPAITATSGFDPFTQFTDAQSDFEVTATMTVVEYNPTAFPYATSGNVPAGDVIYATTDQKPSQEACTYAGLLPVNPIRTS